MAGAPPPMNEAMRVVVRVRPENNKERAKDSQSVISIVDENLLVFDPKVQAAPTYYHGKEVKHRDMNKRKNKDLKFIFDCVLDRFSTQQEVYRASAYEVVKSVVEGYNGSVFAYGATGAGKTHTMLGSVDQPGVIYQTMVDLFKLMELKTDRVFELSVSYMEIYNEAIRDLFACSGSLPLREGDDSGVVITGLTYHSPKSVAELYEMLLLGNQNRTQHPTDANEQSSRSHAVFQVYLRQRPSNSGTTTDFSLSKLSLIDLAGSERATVTSNRGARMREGANINKSLLALGSCINALAENKKNMHVPWRNSKLTRILKDSLGKNCKTCMIAAISPSTLSYEDTQNTLNYALRAKSIKSQLVKKTVSVDEHMGKYTAIIKDLRAENEKLQQQIEELKNATVTQREVEEKTVIQTVYEEAAQSKIVKDLIARIKSVHSKRAELRRSLLQCEAREKQYKMQHYYLEQFRQLITAFCADPLLQQTKIDLINQQEGAIRVGEVTLRDEKDVIISDQATVEEQYSRLCGEIAVTDPAHNELLSRELHIRTLMIEIDDLQQQNQHLRTLANRQESLNTRQNKSLASIARTLRAFYFDAKNREVLTDSQLSQFAKLQDDVFDSSNLDPELQQTSDFDDLDADTNFAQILDFTMLRQISPKTPQAPQARRGACQTPFTGGNIVPRRGTANVKAPGTVNLTNTHSSGRKRKSATPIMSPRARQAVRFKKTTLSGSKDSKNFTKIAAGRSQSSQTPARTAANNPALKQPRSDNKIGSKLYAVFKKPLGMNNSSNIDTSSVRKRQSPGKVTKTKQKPRPSSVVVTSTTRMAIPNNGPPPRKMQKSSSSSSMQTIKISVPSLKGSETPSPNLRRRGTLTLRSGTNSIAGKSSDPDRTFDATKVENSDASIVDNSNVTRVENTEDRAENKPPRASYFSTPLHCTENAEGNRESKPRASYFSTTLHPSASPCEYSLRQTAARLSYTKDSPSNLYREIQSEASSTCEVNESTQALASNFKSAITNMNELSAITDMSIIGRPNSTVISSPGQSTILDGTSMFDSSSMTGGPTSEKVARLLERYRKASAVRAAASQSSNHS